MRKTPRLQWPCLIVAPGAWHQLDPENPCKENPRLKTGFLIWFLDKNDAQKAAKVLHDSEPDSNEYGRLTVEDDAFCAMEGARAYLHGCFSRA